MIDKELDFKAFLNHAEQLFELSDIIEDVEEDEIDESLDDIEQNETV